MIPVLRRSFWKMGWRSGVSKSCLLPNFDCPGDLTAVANPLHLLLLLLARATEPEMVRMSATRDWEGSSSTTSEKPRREAGLPARV
jgi:hypothetical protein